MLILIEKALVFLSYRTFCLIFSVLRSSGLIPEICKILNRGDNLSRGPLRSKNFSCNERAFADNSSLRIEFGVNQEVNLNENPIPEREFIAPISTCESTRSREDCRQVDYSRKLTSDNLSSEEESEGEILFLRIKDRRSTRFNNRTNSFRNISSAVSRSDVELEPGIMSGITCRSNEESIGFTNFAERVNVNGAEALIDHLNNKDVSVQIDNNKLHDTGSQTNNKRLCDVQIDNDSKRFCEASVQTELFETRELLEETVVRHVQETTNNADKEIGVTHNSDFTHASADRIMPSRRSSRNKKLTCIDKLVRGSVLGKKYSQEKEYEMEDLMWSQSTKRGVTDYLANTNNEVIVAENFNISVQTFLNDVSREIKNIISGGSEEKATKMIEWFILSFGQKEIEHCECIGKVCKIFSSFSKNLEKDRNLKCPEAMVLKLNFIRNIFTKSLFSCILNSEYTVFLSKVFCRM